MATLAQKIKKDLKAKFPQLKVSARMINVNACLIRCLNIPQTEYDFEDIRAVVEPYNEIDIYAFCEDHSEYELKEDSKAQKEVITTQQPEEQTNNNVVRSEVEGIAKQEWQETLNNDSFEGVLYPIIADLTGINCYKLEELVYDRPFDKKTFPEPSCYYVEDGKKYLVELSQTYSKNTILELVCNALEDQNAHSLLKAIDDYLFCNPMKSKTGQTIDRKEVTTDKKDDSFFAIKDDPTLPEIKKMVNDFFIKEGELSDFMRMPLVNRILRDEEFVCPLPEETPKLKVFEVGKTYLAKYHMLTCTSRNKSTIEMTDTSGFKVSYNVQLQYRPQVEWIEDYLDTIVHATDSVDIAKMTRKELQKALKPFKVINLTDISLNEKREVLQKEYNEIIENPKKREWERKLLALNLSPVLYRIATNITGIDCFNLDRLVYDRECDISTRFPDCSEKEKADIYTEHLLSATEDLAEAIEVIIETLLTLGESLGMALDNYYIYDDIQSVSGKFISRKKVESKQCETLISEGDYQPNVNHKKALARV